MCDKHSFRDPIDCEDIERLFREESNNGGEPDEWVGISD